MKPEDFNTDATAIGDALSPLAAKLGQTASTLFAWAMRHNYAVAFSDIGFFLLFLVAIIPYPTSSSFGGVYTHPCRYFDRGVIVA